ncbi:MAG: hypothetical protein RL227_2945 [Pseudomonadota bacterium]
MRTLRIAVAPCRPPNHRSPGPCHPASHRVGAACGQRPAEHRPAWRARACRPRCCAARSGTRWPSAVHDLLALRHAAATARVAALRQPEVLRDAWREALAGGKVPGAPWALLTHPPSASLQDGLAVDVRGWLFEQARAGQAGRDVQQQAQQQAASQRAEAEALLEARATAPGPAADLASNQAPNQVPNRPGPAGMAPACKPGGRRRCHPQRRRCPLADPARRPRCTAAACCVSVPCPAHRPVTANCSKRPAPLRRPRRRPRAGPAPARPAARRRRPGGLPGRLPQARGLSPAEGPLPRRHQDLPVRPAAEPGALRPHPGPGRGARSTALRRRARALPAHHAIGAEAGRRERWRDLGAALVALAVVPLVPSWLPVA